VRVSCMMIIQVGLLRVTWSAVQSVVLEVIMRIRHICLYLTASMWSNHCLAVRIAGAAIIPSSRPLLRGLLRAKTTCFRSVLLRVSV
jgi:hypothetical protein